MKRLLIASVATIGLTILGVGAAHAGDQGCSTPVAVAPVPSGTVAQGQPATGSRTYSSQPTTGYRTYSYQPGVTNYPSNSSPSRSQPSGFHNAGWKIRGGF